MTKQSEQEVEALAEKIGSLTVGEEPHEIRNFLGHSSLEVVARFVHIYGLQERIDGLTRTIKLLDNTQVWDDKTRSELLSIRRELQQELNKGE